MIDEAEAAEALRDVARIHQRTSTAGAYAHASPHMILTGLVWGAGYLGSGLLPPAQWGMVWFPLAAICVIGTGAISLRQFRSFRGTVTVKRTQQARGLWLALVITAFIVSTMLLFRPSDPDVVLAFPGLVLGLVYGVVGVWGMPRFLWIGGAVTAATIAGILLTPHAIAFWIAAAGGGGLILGGLWLRKV